jgi:hypothetical protein
MTTAWIERETAAVGDQAATTADGPPLTVMPMRARSSAICG